MSSASSLLKRVESLEKRLKKIRKIEWTFEFRRMYNQKQMDRRLRNLCLAADLMNRTVGAEYRKALSRWASLSGYYDKHEEARDKAIKRRDELRLEGDRLEVEIAEIKRQIPTILTNFITG